MCSVLSFCLVRTPCQLRRKFTLNLFKVAEQCNIELHGYIRRVSTERVEVKIIVECCNLRAMQGFIQLARMWSVDLQSIHFEPQNFDEVQRLYRRFDVVQTDREPENWSNGFEEAENFSIVSSIGNR